MSFELHRMKDKMVWAREVWRRERRGGCCRKREQLLKRPGASGARV